MKHIKAISGKGVLGEVEKHKIPNNKKDYQDIVLYYKADSDQTAAVRVQSTLCLPVFKHTELAGILEISNSKNHNFSFDEEFYGVILSKYLSNNI